MIRVFRLFLATWLILTRIFFDLLTFESLGTCSTCMPVGRDRGICFRVSCMLNKRTVYANLLISLQKMQKKKTLTMITSFYDSGCHDGCAHVYMG